MAKFAAAEAGIHCVDGAVQAHGGNGFALKYGLSDLLWGLPVTRTAPDAREMGAQLRGRALTCPR